MYLEIDLLTRAGTRLALDGLENSVSESPWGTSSCGPPVGPGLETATEAGLGGGGGSFPGGWMVFGFDRNNALVYLVSGL